MKTFTQFVSESILDTDFNGPEWLDALTDFSKALSKLAPSKAPNDVNSKVAVRGHTVACEGLSRDCLERLVATEDKGSRHILLSMLEAILLSQKYTAYYYEDELRFAKVENRDRQSMKEYIKKCHADIEKGNIYPWAGSICSGGFLSHWYDGMSSSELTTNSGHLGPIWKTYYRQMSTYAESMFNKIGI